MSKTINGRLAYADLLRGFATLAAIFVYLIAPAITSVSVGSATFRVLVTYEALVRWCVPVFLMLSGMFMLDPKRGLPLGKLLLHNLLRVFIALVVWATVYALVGAALNGRGLAWSNLGPALVSALKGNTHSHLWFLYTIMGLYLITPVLRAFLKGASRRDLHWFFLLCFLFASLIPTLLRLRPNAVLSGYVDKLGIHLVLGYVGYYVLGYYLKAYLLSRPAEYLIYLLGILSGVFTVLATLNRSLRLGSPSLLFLNYSSPNIVLLSLAVFVLFRYVLGVSEERSRRQRLGTVALVSFGIYLVHDLFLMVLRHFGISVLSFTPILSVPVLALVVFLPSFAVAWLLNRIPLLGRYLS